MNRLRRSLKHSLATRVILSTLFLSLTVVSLTGSALYSRLADGILATSLNSSLAEARYTFFNAEYQVLASQSMTVQARKEALAEFVVRTSTQGINEERREVIFAKSPGGPTTANSYEMSSNVIKNSSIPRDLRAQIKKDAKLHYAYGPARYNNGESIDSLFVGQRIIIPTGGRYEIYIIFSLKNQTATVDLIKNSLLLTGIALIFLIGLITWLVVRQVVRPVREAARIANQFTQGDFTQRMKVVSTDEMATLAISYNEMAMSIEEQITRLEHLSRVQQRFVSDVTHELRTPLTTLRMASEVIHIQRSSFDPLVARSSELLVAQLDRFERLLEDLLEVSRFDAEVAVLEPVDFDVIGLINRCAADFDMGGTVPTRDIQVEADEESVTINADIRRVERIMRNLLSNALDHAEGKKILVNVVATDTEVGIGVRDYGSGLDESALTRVFDRFWREDPSRARVRGGTGLGLSIALEDARLHNGELDAWGRPNQGAHFVLTLPRKAGELINSRPIKATPKDFHQEAFYQ